MFDGFRDTSGGGPDHSARRGHGVQDGRAQAFGHGTQHEHVEAFQQRQHVRAESHPPHVSFEPQVLDLVLENKPYGFDQLMLDLLKHKRRVRSFPHDGFWLDIGRPSDYEKAQGETARLVRGI